MFGTLKQIWALLLKAVYFISIILLLIAGYEMLKMFVFFYRLHPVAGWAFAVLLGAFLLGSLIYFRNQLGRLPRVLNPPKLESVEDAPHRGLVKFARYQKAYLQRLAQNSSLEEEQRNLIEPTLENIDSTLKAHPLRDDLQRLILSVDERTINPCLIHLNEKASGEVRACVRDVMLAVTLSPYRVIDLLVVLYRNGSMILKIAQIYESRPGLRAQILILNDTIRVVATVNFLNLSRNLIESLFARLPVVGRVAEDIGQGVGAGFFTSLAGHAAIQRCAAYEGWAYEDAVLGLGAKSKQFLDDVRGIFLKDVLPQLRGRIQADPENQGIAGQTLDGLTRAVNGAFDATLKTVNDYMFRPAMAGTQTVFQTGARMVTGQPAQPRIEKRRKSKPSKKPNGVKRIFKNVRQRLKYRSY